MRTVVFANQGIGDIVMAFPLLQALSAQPQDELLIIAQANYHRGVVALAFDDGCSRTEIVGMRELGAGILARAYSLVRLIRQFGPDAIVIPYAVDHVRGAMISWLSGASIRIGPNAGPLRWMFTHHLSGDMTATPGFHKVEENKRAARILGRDPPVVPTLVQAIQPQGCDISKIAGLPGGIIGIALGSGPEETHKRLPTHIAQRLIVELLERYPESALILLGGSAEVHLNSGLAIAGGNSQRLIDLTGKTNFAELLSVLSMCRVIVTTCNGISHLAALARCPIVGLFGPTDPVLTGPCGSELTIIRRELACSPCYTRSFWRGCGAPVCMQLSTDEIVAAVGSYVGLEHAVASPAASR